MGRLTRLNQLKRKITAAVWCVPFSGAVGLFNKLQTQKKEEKLAYFSPNIDELVGRSAKKRSPSIVQLWITTK